MSGANQSHIAVSDFTLLMQEGGDASSSTACVRYHRYFSHRSSSRCSQRAGQKQWPVGKLACIYDSDFRGYDRPTSPEFRVLVRPTPMKLTFSRSTRTAMSPSL